MSPMEHKGSLTVTQDLQIDGGATVSGAVLALTNLPGEVESHSLFVPFPGSGVDGNGDGSEDVYFELNYGATVVQSTVRTVSGTLDYSLLIDGTVVEGLDNQPVSGTKDTNTSTSANILLAGDELRVAISGADNAKNFRLTMKTTRT